MCLNICMQVAFTVLVATQLTSEEYDEDVVSEFRQWRRNVRGCLPPLPAS